MLSREALTPFVATAVDDGAATAGGHAGTEAVGACALDAAGLECTLHWSRPNAGKSNSRPASVASRRVTGVGTCHGISGRQKKVGYSM